MVAEGGAEPCEFSVGLSIEGCDTDSVDGSRKPVIVSGNRMAAGCDCI
jgi:hypothetical protein